ncbi:NAD(P)-dependent oxidoreductase [Jiangella aurantiaca]|uniref:NAD(P)-dependent oxidoreductase n=1 Tax=Jiangella aurantiaca TaxID=2530373 RepID=A0A4R5AKY6_9ACTN|nr:NAD(P)-dependent oxidoreductase [Jiangella aurantiaca]TDD70732.1 NAD(P)-dependent oxidoreductase [Jiangella aurantiaca]
MRILITGVAGRVGTELATRSLASGHAVRGTVRPGGRVLTPALARDVEVVEVSLADAGSLARAVDGVDVVVHLAARMVPGDRPIDELFDGNVLGTLRLLEAAASARTPVRRLVLASTDNTYGPARPRFTPITEDHPQVPGDYYGTSKLLAEQLVQNLAELHGLEYTIVRLGSVVEPHEVLPLFRLDWTQAFLTAQHEAGRRGNLWALFADRPDLALAVNEVAGARDDNPAVALAGPAGEPWAIHLTHVRDAADGLLLAVERAEAAGEDFNMVGPRTTTFSEGAAVMARQFGLDTVTVELPVTLAFELSNQKAAQRLGYAPSRDFAAIVRAAVSGPDLAGTRVS